MSEIMATKAGIKKRIAELKPELEFWCNKYISAQTGPDTERRDAEFRYRVLEARIAELEWVLGIGYRRRAKD